MSAPALPTALAAFLRGIEPRARVLARAQAGPSLDDATLLSEVREEFAARAPRLPLAEWPLRYWGLLLARGELATPVGPTPAHPLYRLSHTRRLALLLRLVVGLEPAGAARVLGLSETAYRALWNDAEDKLAELGVAPSVLMRWQESFQQEVRGSAELEAARPRAAVAVASASAAAKRSVRRASRWRLSGLQWGLVAVATLLLALLAATFVWPPGAPGRQATGASAAPAAAEAPASLEPAPAAGPRRDLDADLVVDPDFALLASPADAPWRSGVGFLGWLADARGIALPRPAATAAPASVQDWSALASEAQGLLAPVRAAWPALDGEAQAGLLAQAEAWRGFDLARREALRAAYRDWLALPALERSAQRAAFAEWKRLDEGERAALSEAAAAFAALPATEQQARRLEFAALDPQLQQDWALGPRLGRQLPGLRPLLLHLPAAERADLIDALEGLDEATRAALAERIAAMGAAERAALRGRVLAAPVEDRSRAFAAAAAPP